MNTKAPKMEATHEDIGTVGNEDELTCNHGTWAGTEPITYTYQWGHIVFGNFVAIPGATEETLRTTTALNNEEIRCEVTARNGGGEASEPSSNEFTVLTTPPVLTAVEKPENFEEIGSVEFLFEVQDRAPVTATCKVNGGEVKPCTPTEPIEYFGLEAGEHRFEMNVVHARGNEAQYYRSWYVKFPARNTEAPHIETGPLLTKNWRRRTPKPSATKQN